MLRKEQIKKDLIGNKIANKITIVSKKEKKILENYPKMKLTMKYQKKDIYL